MHPKSYLVRIRIRQSEVRIRGSRSASGFLPKCHGSGTLVQTRNDALVCYVFFWYILMCLRLLFQTRIQTWMWRRNGRPLNSSPTPFTPVIRNSVHSPALYGVVLVLCFIILQVCTLGKYCCKSNLRFQGNLAKKGCFTRTKKCYKI